MRARRAVVFFLAIFLRWFARSTRTLHLISTRNDKRRRSSTMRLQRTTCLANILVLATQQFLLLLVNGQVEPCPQDPTLTGYTTVAAMNADMEAELALISNGQEAQSGYTYVLCPDTAFDATQVALTPVLNNITFVCGSTGSSSDNCVLFGGDEQIRIEDSIVPDYPLSMLSFVGLSFANFTGNAINAAASSTTSASFNDISFEGYNTTGSALNIANPDGEGMLVDMSGVNIGTGLANTFFNNDRGVLTLRNIEANGVNTTSIVSTANGGVSFLQDSQISNSTLSSVAFATNGGAQTVTDVVVSDNNQLGTVFTAEGEGTSLSLRDVDIVDNVLTRQQWVGVSGFNGATVTADNLNITANDGLLIAVQTGSLGRATLRDSLISGNTSPLLETSASIFATNGTAVVENTIFTDNQGFTNSIDDYVVYEDTLSSIESETDTNFVGNIINIQCPFGTDRLFSESADSQCFVDGDPPPPCFGECLPFATAGACRAGEGRGPPTSPPTTAPAVPNTPAPVEPTTASPVAPPTPAEPTTTAPVPAPTTSMPVAPTTPTPVAPTTTMPVAPTTTMPVPPTTTMPVATSTSMPVAPTTMAPASMAPSLPCIPRAQVQGASSSSGKKSGKGKGGKGDSLRGSTVYYLPGWNDGNGVWLGTDMREAENLASVHLPFCPDDTDADVDPGIVVQSSKGKGGKGGKKSSSSKGKKGKGGKKSNSSSGSKGGKKGKGKRRLDAEKVLRQP